MQFTRDFRSRLERLPSAAKDVYFSAFGIQLDPIGESQLSRDEVIVQPLSFATANPSRGFASRVRVDEGGICIAIAFGEEWTGSSRIKEREVFDLYTILETIQRKVLVQDRSWKNESGSKVTTWPDSLTREANRTA